MDYERLHRVVKELASKKGVSLTNALIESGVKKNFFWSIEKQGSVPSVEKLQALAVYFDVSVDYLIGNTDVPEVNRAEESPQMALARAIAALPEDKRQAIENLVAGLAGSNKQE